MKLPFVSCIMPTHNRRSFVPLAVEYFLRQDYPDSELVIVDTGTDAISGLIPDRKCIRYIRIEKRRTIGAVRNLACEAAKGELILHWDDDDWHAPHRIRYQVEELMRGAADVCGVNPALFYDCRSDLAWRYSYPALRRPWVHGSSLCYRLAFWKSVRFEDVDVGEDTRFIWSSDSVRLHALPDSTVHVSVIHGANVSAYRSADCRWRPEDTGMLRRLFGPDEAFYRELRNRGRRSLRAPDTHGQRR
jgi:glycosyltransferase involved in cell wall biosynthesis